MRVTIRHDEPEGSAELQVTVVTVVTVGELGASDQQMLLAAGEEATVEVRPGQFVMVDDKEA